MVIEIGAFGKVPSYPEFVTIGSRTKTSRSLERWMEMSNDQLARADMQLSSTPIGFCYRDDDAVSLLIGVLIGSRDKVGRRFPLAVFCEVDAADPNTRVSHLTEAFRPALTQASMLAMTAMETDVEAFKRAVARIERPGLGTIKDGLASTDAVHQTIRLEQVLSRVFASVHDRAYGFSVLQRACAQSRRDGCARATAVDVTVTSDVELSFWLATVESQLPEAHGPVSAFWEVPSQRGIIIPGVPNSKILLALASPHSQDAKIWRTVTSSKRSRDGAWKSLAPKVRAILEQPGDASIQEFLAAFRVDPTS